MLLKRLIVFLAFVALFAFQFPASSRAAGDEPLDCMGCHDEVQPHSAAHAAVTCQECHSNVTDRRGHRKTALAELSGDAICVQCHRLAAKELQRSVHRGRASCVDCHGSAHDVPLNSDLASPVSPFHEIQTCGSCHERGGLIEAYRNSVHGKGLLQSGLINSASCSDCHGAHVIVPVANPAAPTARQHSPEMCGQCHIGVLERWIRDSAHGKAWSAGETEGPVCTTCHQSHAIEDPRRGGTRQGMPNECGNCHGERYSSYRLTFHGKSTELGLLSVATCSDCHTAHANLPASDPRSSIHPKHLRQTCGACHGKVPDAFLAIDMHNDPTDPNVNAYVYYVYVFMMALLIGVFAFFALHDLLWLQRTLVGSWRGEFHRIKFGRQRGPYVRRFPGLYIVLHVVVIITFLLLALTGLPLKFHDAAWAQSLMNALGGVAAANVIHRIAAIGTFGYMGVHLLHLAYRAIVKHEHGLFWGPNSLTPQWQDLKDLFANFRYFLYLGPRPPGDRWTYWEKFDYLAVFWGVMIIGVSGLMLWFPAFFTKFLPGWTINAALVVHSDEALLATGFIFVFHFFHTHLRPESFPMDPVVFTGRLPMERFKEERPLEYQRMVEQGSLEASMSEPPSRQEMGWTYAFGFLALGVGLILAVAIFWALLSR